MTKPTKEPYSLTEEHRAQLQPWAEKWIANAMSTKPMDEEDYEICTKAVHDMYGFTGRKPPKVVFVPSPLVAIFATGFASASIYQASKGFNAQITPDEGLIYQATLAALDKDTSKYAVIRARPFKREGDLSKWYVHNEDVKRQAASLNVDRFGRACAARSHSFRQGGNQWSSWSAYLSFFRHVVKLGESHGVDYSKWATWETLSERSGVRFVREQFCIISDRPRILKVDDRNRPHSENGPFSEWSDGFGMYAWHGTRVPAEWLLHKEKLDPATALNHPNVEQRRAAAEIVGWKKVLDTLKPKVIDKDKDPEIGTLLEVDLPDSKGTRFLQVKCGTGRTFVLPVPSEMRTALEANAWTYNLEPGQLKLEART